MIQKSYEESEYGKLYLVPTPIGNLDDITNRGIKTLQMCDIVYAEDTRETLKLLKTLDISKRVESCHKYTEMTHKDKIISILKSGKNIAYVTDRGTPLISDPGNVIVDYAIEEGIINKKDFTNYDRAITREEMAYIFANIIPEEAMEEINDVYEIPDVDEDNKYYYEILYLYNVGVLSGSDAKGTFNPKANISRAEVSAIIVRVADPDERRENNF